MAKLFANTGWRTPFYTLTGCQVIGFKRHQRLLQLFRISSRNLPRLETSYLTRDLEPLRLLLLQQIIAILFCSPLPFDSLHFSGRNNKLAEWWEGWEPCVVLKALFIFFRSINSPLRKLQISCISIEPQEQTWALPSSLLLLDGPKSEATRPGPGSSDWLVRSCSK